jgi:hypothetical protein
MPAHTGRASRGAEQRPVLDLPKAQEARLETAIGSVKQELQNSDPKRAVVSEGLKIVKDIAVKVIASTAEKADWHSMLNQLGHYIRMLT